MPLTSWDMDEEYRSEIDFAPENVFAVYRQKNCPFTTVVSVQGYRISVADDVDVVKRYLNAISISRAK